ncbi:MAG: tRNA (adenosine(37)-N6)-dimethylallyltransferase MiaA [Flammeovirgaceae bacterium]|nr:MAG: tRNA (adenosine(37)-N6)-dimethylallyltransferase MiaA [Flammeovirgaceae bacterium]
MIEGLYFWPVDWSKKKLIVLVGPTASGKTALAVKLARHLQTEIISADSRQVYRELTIGTAKPSAEELAAIRHHFINSLTITEDYDAATYGEEAFALTCRLFEKYNWLIVCGGSGLYVKALLEGFDDIPEVPDEIRDELTDRYAEYGLSWLQAKLNEVDPESFNTLDAQNPQRLLRALEVKLATGKSIKEFQKKQKRQLPFRVIKIGLDVERELLYKRIDERMDSMIEAGLFTEAEQLYPFRTKNALQTVGYQEVFDFMEGKYDRTEAIRLLKRNSRRYAKRQLTWFRRDAEINWVNPDDWDEILRLIG